MNAHRYTWKDIIEHCIELWHILVTFFQEQAPAHGNCSAANVSVVTVLSAVGNNSTVSSTCSSQAQLTHLPVVGDLLFLLFNSSIQIV